MELMYAYSVILVMYWMYVQNNVQIAQKKVVTDPQHKCEWILLIILELQ